MRYRPVFFFCLLLWQPTALAELPESLLPVQAALAKLDATDLDADWYFTMAVTEGEELRIIESDPHRGLYERRQLVSVNGEPPDKTRLEEFREAEEQRIDDLDPDAQGYVRLVDMETVSLVGEGDDHARYIFVPRVKDLEKSREDLRGTLLLNHHTGRIDRLDIHNTGQLKPAFSVTVDTYRLALSFGEEQGEQLLQRIESRAVGKAGFLKSFDSDVTVVFRDFRTAQGSE